MSITELSIKRPTLIIVLFLFLIVLGTISYLKLNYELIPDITPPMMSVTVIYPGASPKEVETSVTKIIEESVNNIEKIKRVTSYSQESVGLLFVEFSQSANAAVALQEVQRRVNEVLSKLPKECEIPVVSKFSINEMPVLRIAALSEMPEREFHEFMKDNVKPRLARLDGVGNVTLFGGEEREIKINVRRDKLQSYHLSILEVLETIKKANFDFPAGRVKDENGQYTVRLTGKLNSVDAIRNIIIRDSKETGKLRVGDIAEVQDGVKETVAFSRLNKKSALAVFIQKQTDANTVAVAELVKKELRSIEQEYEKTKLRFDVAQDASVFTMESANAVKFDLLFAVFLVGLVMMLFLHSLRNSIIIMVAIPCSLISTFIAMYAFGFTLNIMTLLALSLVIGILVDDSIVVLENIYRHLEMGKDRKTASIEGRNEIGFTALSITLIDVVVFLPLALIGGMIGDLVRQFALVIVVATLLSLLVSFTVTPMLASRFSKSEKLNKGTLSGGVAVWFENLFDSFGKLYAQLLTKALRNKILVVSMATILLIGSVALIPLGFIGSEFLSPADKGELSVILELKPGARLEETNEVARMVEQQLLARADVKKVLTNVGSSEEGFIGMYSNNIAELIVTLVPKEKRTKSVTEVGEEFKAMVRDIPGVKPRVAPIMIFGTTDMAPVAVGINGSDIANVETAADKIMGIMKKIPGTSDVMKSSETGKPELHVQINREKMAALGLSLDQVGAELRVALTGDNSSKFRDGNSEYDIRIIYDEFDKNDPVAVNKISFPNMRGEQVFLSQFADVQLSSGPSKLERKYRNNSITVTSRAIGRPAGDIGEDIKKEIAKLDMPSGIQITYENDLENQEDAFGSLGFAFLSAIIFVYLILAALYNSFIYPLTILFTIPLAIIGAVLGLALTMNSINIMTLLGMIVLVGLVGKNGILLVDRTNQNRANGMNIMDALVEAARVRLRPILMTTATLIFGVLPIALSKGAANEMKSGLAVVLIGGLTSSLLLTLILVPVIYIYVDRMQTWLLKIKTWILRLAGAKFSLKAYSKVPTIILLFLLSGFVLTGTAQPLPLSMNAAVKRGLENNSGIKIADFSRVQSEKKEQEAFGALLPEVSAEGTYVRNLKLPVMFLPGDFFGQPTSPSIPIEIGEKNTYEGTLKLQVPLYNAGIYPGIRAAHSEVLMNSENHRNTQVITANEIKKTYLQALVLKQQILLMQQSLSRAKLRLKDVRNLFIQGLTADVDTLTAYIGIQNILPQMLKLQNAEENSMRMLAYLMGESKPDFVLTDSLGLPADPDSPNEEQAILTAETGRADLRMLEHGISVAGEMENAAFAAHLPSLSAFGSVKIETQNKELNVSDYKWQTSSLVGLQITVPIFSGFKTQAKVEEAAIERKKLEEQLNNLHGYLNIEVRAAVNARDEAKKSLEIQRQNITLAERNYVLLQSRFRSGLAKLSDLLDAEMVLHGAKMNLYTEVFNFLVAQADVEKSLGRF